MESISKGKERREKGIKGKKETMEKKKSKITKWLEGI